MRGVAWVGSAQTILIGRRLLVGFSRFAALLEEQIRRKDQPSHSLLRLGSEQRVCGQGDVIVIPGGMEHETWFREDDYPVPRRSCSVRFEDQLLGHVAKLGVELVGNRFTQTTRCERRYSPGGSMCAKACSAFKRS